MVSLVLLSRWGVARCSASVSGVVGVVMAASSVSSWRGRDDLNRSCVLLLVKNGEHL